MTAFNWHFSQILTKRNRCMCLLFMNHSKELPFLLVFEENFRIFLILFFWSYMRMYRKFRIHTNMPYQSAFLIVWQHWMLSLIDSRHHGCQRQRDDIYKYGWIEISCRQIKCRNREFRFLLHRSAVLSWKFSLLNIHFFFGAKLRQSSFHFI